MATRSIFFLVLVCSGLTQQARGQNKGPLLPLDDPSLWHYQSLLARGFLSSLDAGSFPINESSYSFGLQRVSGDLSDFASRSRRRLFVDSTVTSGNYGVRLRPGLSVANQEASNFLRPEADPANVVYTLLDFESWFTAGGFTAAWGWRHDRYYDRDPEGLDTAHRWAIRPENAYVSYTGKYAQVFLGRVRSHWGGYSESAFLLSDNPRPMDRFAFRIGSDRLNIATSLSELDSITGDGVFSGTAGDDSVSSGSERRYLAVHKLTFAKPGAWSVGLMHSILYSGANSGLSLKFLNPLHLALLSVDEKPKNDENNGLIGAFVQVQRPLTLIQGNIAIDDFDVVNGKEPASIAATLYLHRANVLKKTDLAVGSTIVTGRTFNAEQPEGRYTYLQRGIGTQNSDFVTGFVSATIFLRSGITLSPRLDVLFQGEGDFHQPFPAHEEAPAIFKGVVERTLRPSLSVKVQTHSMVDIVATGGFNWVDNENHVSGTSGTNFSGGLAVSYRFMWQGAY